MARRRGSAMRRTASLGRVTFSRGLLGYGYDSAGRVSTVSDPGGVDFAFTYDGALPLSETWSGPIAGVVSRTFTTNFEVATEEVSGTSAVGFGCRRGEALTRDREGALW